MVNGDIQILTYVTGFLLLGAFITHRVNQIRRLRQVRQGFQYANDNYEATVRNEHGEATTLPVEPAPTPDLPIRLRVWVALFAVALTLLVTLVALRHHAITQAVDRFETALRDGDPIAICFAASMVEVTFTYLDETVGAQAWRAIADVKCREPRPTT